jgi:small-conductance mechanosensitive channel
MDLWIVDPESQLSLKGTATLGLAVLVLVARGLIAHVVARRTKVSKRIRRRWLVTARNLAVLVFLLGGAVIWLEELQQVATALALVATGFVIATRELWLNLSGYFFRSGANLIAVGDRVEIGEFRGDVMDHGLAGATLLEVGAKSQQYTGRAVFVPNKRFLSTAVANESHMAGFLFHTLSIPMTLGEDWQSAEKAILQAATEVCEPYLEKARANLKELAVKHSLDAPAVTPTVHVSLPEAGKLNLMLRVPVPARRKGRTEQAILRRYLSLVAESRERSSPPSSVSRPEPDDVAWVDSCCG